MQRKHIGFLGFHSGRPHLDDLLAAVLGTLLWCLSIDYKRVNLILNAEGITNAAAQEMWEKGRNNGDSIAYAAWVGTTPNGGPRPLEAKDMWCSPLDEHGSGDATDSATQLVLKLAGGEASIKARMREHFRNWGVPATDENVAYAARAIDHFVVYTTLKDNFAVAMRLGISWLLKQLNRTSCFVLRDNQMVELPYKGEFIRRDMEWVHRLAVTYATQRVPINYGADLQRVEASMVDWYLQREDIPARWKPETPPATMRQLMEMVQAEEKRRQRVAKTRGTHPPKAGHLIRKIRGLCALVSDMQNPADWGDPESWLLHGWLGRNPDHVLKMRVTQATRISEVIEHVEGRLRALNGRTDVTRLMARLAGTAKQMETLQKQVIEERASRAETGTDERSDERSPRSPYGMVMTTILLLQRARRTDGLGFPNGNEVARDYVSMALDAHWDKLLLADHAQQEVQAAKNDPAHTRQIACRWEVDHERPTVLWVDSRNPEVGAEARKEMATEGVKRFPLVITSCELDEDGAHYGACHIGADQRYFGIDWTDLYFRHLGGLLRLMELKRQGNPLPDDLESLLAPNQLQDHVWFLHVNGSDKAVQIMARSLHKRDAPGTHLDAETELLPAAAAVYTVLSAFRAKGVFGEQTGTFGPGGARSALRQLRRRIAAASNMASELQLALQEMEASMLIQTPALLPYRLAT